MIIDLSEKFERLPRAPIVEAVIEIRARAEATWEEGVIASHLRPRLPEYPNVTSKIGVRHEFQLDAGKSAQAATRDLGWQGLLFQSGDGRHIAQFNREGFVFSRVYSYESWQQLHDEAMRLWTIHAEVARPTETQRIGLRFINRIVLPLHENNFEDYIQPYPEPPRDLDLPFVGFFHQDTLAVPGYPYAINIVRTIQSPQNPSTDGISLILDIDVCSIQPIELRDGMLDTRLAEMRWLKNKTFFGSVTSKALEMFR